MQIETKIDRNPSRSNPRVDRNQPVLFFPFPPSPPDFIKKGEGSKSGEGKSKKEKEKIREYP